MQFPWLYHGLLSYVLYAHEHTYGVVLQIICDFIQAHDQE